MRQKQFVSRQSLYRSILTNKRRHDFYRHLIVVLIITLLGFLAVDSKRQKSITIDEPLHLTAGYTYWKFNDYRLQLSHGALPQRLFAVPLLFEDLKFPDKKSDSWRQPDYLGYKVCFDFLFNSGNDSNRIISRGRNVAIIILLFCALAVYYWTSQIFGGNAGVLSCLLFASSPTMIAHGRLMTSDMLAMLFFLMTTGMYYRLLKRVTWFNLIGSVISFGMLAVSKMSGGVGIVMVCLMTLVHFMLGGGWGIRLRGFEHRNMKSLRQKISLLLGVLGAHVITAIVIIWCFYGLQSQPSMNWEHGRDQYIEPWPSVHSSLGQQQQRGVNFLRNTRLLPDAYIYGLAHTLKHAKERPTYMLGMYGNNGWWYYFPFCFAVKTPVVIMLFILLGFLAIVYRCVGKNCFRRSRCLFWLHRTSLFWSILVVYGVAALFTNLNIGHRHIVPIYPALFAVAGAATWWLWWCKGKWLIITIILFLSFQSVVLFQVHPNYLSYFNVPSRLLGPGYRLLTDSNVDWGQDLPALRQWLLDNSSTIEGELYVQYFGIDVPERWGIRSKNTYFFMRPPEDLHWPVIFNSGLYCYSSTALISPPQGIPWHDDHEEYYRKLVKTFTTQPDNRQLGLELIEMQNLKLRHYLIGREPDHIVGGSILLFYLDKNELRSALYD